MSALGRTRIKFCGLTRELDIELAISLGVDAIGLIVHAPGPRALELARAAELRRRLPALVSCVLLSLDADVDSLRRMVDWVRPDLLQLHGNEPVEVAQAAGRPYLKAIPMAQAASAQAMLDAHADHAAGFVLDAHAPGAAGGAGRAFDWTRLPQLHGRPWLLAGGLNADNVSAAIELCRPYGVDVSSGIETAPGQKCRQRMQAFVAAVRRADAQLIDEDAA